MECFNIDLLQIFFVSILLKNVFFTFPYFSVSSIRFFLSEYQEVTFFTFISLIKYCVL